MGVCGGTETQYKYEEEFITLFLMDIEYSENEMEKFTYVSF
jgi:hypothetical protein